MNIVQTATYSNKSLNFAQAVASGNTVLVSCGMVDHNATETMDGVTSAGFTELGKHVYGWAASKNMHLGLYSSTTAEGITSIPLVGDGGDDDFSAWAIEIEGEVTFGTPSFDSGDAANIFGDASVSEPGAIGVILLKNLNNGATVTSILDEVDDPTWVEFQRHNASTANDANKSQNVGTHRADVPSGVVEIHAGNGVGGSRDFITAIVGITIGTTSGPQTASLNVNLTTTNYTYNVSEVKAFSLDDVPADFSVADGVRATISSRLNRDPATVDDYVGLGVRIVSGSTVLAAQSPQGNFSLVRDSGWLATNQSDEVIFPFVNVGADKALWDAANIELSQVYAVNLSTDDVSIILDSAQVSVDFDPANQPPTTTEVFGEAALGSSASMSAAGAREVNGEVHFTTQLIEPT